MPLAFAVDSARTVTCALYEELLRWAGTKPRAWGRYLGEGGGAAAPLTQGEVAFLHQQDVGILLVFNDVDRQRLLTRRNGEDAATLAVGEARALDAPTGVGVYADIERGWPVTSEWLIGWAQAVAAAGFVTGAYLMLSDPSVQRTMAAMRSREPVLTAHLALWTARWLHEVEWVTMRDGRISTPRWLPLSPSEDATQVGVWQFAGPSCNKTVDLDLVDPNAEPKPALWLP